jgi:hypothetical protein
MNRLTGSPAAGRLVTTGNFDLGKTSATVAGIIGNPPLRGRFDVLHTMWIVRAGVNYKFGG